MVEEVVVRHLIGQDGGRFVLLRRALHSIDNASGLGSELDESGIDSLSLSVNCAFFEVGRLH